MTKLNYLSELFGKPMGFLCDMCLQEKGNLVAVAEKEIWEIWEIVQLQQFPQAFRWQKTEVSGEER